MLLFLLRLFSVSINNFYATTNFYSLSYLLELLREIKRASLLSFYVALPLAGDFTLASFFIYFASHYVGGLRFVDMLAICLTPSLVLLLISSLNTFRLLIINDVPGFDKQVIYQSTIQMSWESEILRALLVTLAGLTSLLLANLVGGRA